MSVHPVPDSLPLRATDVRYLLSYFNGCESKLQHCRCCGAALKARGDHSSETCKPDCLIRIVRAALRAAE